MTPASLRAAVRGLGLAAMLGLLVAPALSRASGVCGDGALDAGETCDDGNLSSADCCSDTCELTACSSPAQLLVSWEDLGPGDLGGRVSALAVDPANPSRILVGTPASGLWRSADGGISWEPAAPWLDVAPISAIAIDPADGDRWIVGTGVLQDSGGVADAVGSLSTVNAGAAWVFQADPARKAFVGSILVWSGDPQRVLLATDRGIALSLDGGLTFQDVKTGDSFTTVVQDPFQTDAVYASGRQGIYRSTNRGASWTLLADWPGIDSFEGVGAARALLAPSRTTPGLLRAAVQDLATFSDTDRILLLESTNGGATWSELPVPAGLCPVTDLCGFATALAIDPANDARMLLGGDRLYRSIDGGQSWTVFGPELRGIHAVVPTPAGAVVAGRFGVATLDAAWQTAALRNAGLAITQVVSLDAALDGRLLVGTRDDGTVLRSGAPAAWSVVFGADEPSSQARFDPFAPSVLYAGLRRGDFSRSSDGGQSWTTITSGLSPLQPAIDVTPLAPNPLRAGHLYTGRLQMYESTDRGSLWTPYRPLGAPEVAVIAPSPHDDNRVYFALHRTAQLFKGDEIHTDVFALSNDLDERITSILPAPDFGHTLYVGTTNDSTQAGRLWRTTDFGATWEDRSFGKLPAVSDVVKDEHGTLYAATSKGVYRSASEGFVWSPFNEGMPTGLVGDLALQDGHVVAATRGRGVFRAPAVPLTTVDTIPPGQLILVDGVLRRGPVYVDWAAGTQHTLAPYLLQTADTRQEFVSWMNGGTEVQTFTATGGNDWPTVAIRVLHRLTTNVSPAGAGSLVIEPSSADGFHPFQSFVQLIAVPGPDQRVAGWSGQANAVDRLLAGVQMDGPRSLTAHFEPLQIVLQTEPAGLPLEIDGETVVTPQLFQWEAGSLHPFEAPAAVDLDPGDDVELRFDHWSDYLPRVHDFEMRRETFTADVTAYYRPVVPATDVPAYGTQRVDTLGEAHARTEVAMSLRPAPGQGLPPSLQLLRSVADGQLVNELALPRRALVSRVNTWVEGREIATTGGLTGDGRVRRTRVALFNPGATAVSLDLVLHDVGGTALAGGAALVTVPAGGHRTFLLEQLIGLPKTYEGVLTLDASGLLAMTVLAQTENLRLNDFTDPILSHLFDESDAGAPPSPESQALLVTPDTEHLLVLVNPLPQVVSGTLTFRDRDGAPLVAQIADQGGTQDASELNYGVDAGGYRALRVRFPNGVPTGDAYAHARVELTPTAGQPAPQLRHREERQVGSARNGPLVLWRSLPASRPVSAFRVPVDRARRESAVLLTNRGAADVTVSFVLRDGPGAVVDTASLLVPAGAQRLATVSSLFASAPAGLLGQLEVSAPSDLFAVAASRAQNARGEEIWAGLPVLDDSAGAADADHAYDFAVDGDTWASEWWMLGPDATPRRVTLAVTGASGEERTLPMRAPLTP